MKHIPTSAGHIGRLLARLRLPSLPDRVEIAYGRLVKVAYWLLALAWLWPVGAQMDVIDVFSPDPDYLQRNRIAACRAKPTPAQRGDCVTRYMVGTSNEKFYRVVITALPPLLLIPLCTATLRRMGRAGERKLRVLPLA